MGIIRKTFLRCDVCKRTIEAPEDIDKLGIRPFDEGHAALEGWIEIQPRHHLCPTCAKPYLAKKAEMERELKRLAGIETIVVDL